MKVAVAILNFNGEKLLPRFLPSVLRHSGSTTMFQVEIIVADNASTDGSLAVLKRDFPSLTVIELKENSGYSGGYNRAINQIDADVVVLLNSDVEVSEGWLEEPMRILIKDYSIAAVQPKIRSLTNPEVFDYAGAAGGFMDALGYPYCRGRILSTIEKDRGQYDDDIEITWGSGACLFIRKQDFEHAGGLAEEFFAHMEEIDLCWRLQRMGKKIMYCGKSVVFHLGGGTLATGSPRKTYLNFRNSLSMLYRNLPAGRTIPILLIRMILDLVAALKFLVGGYGSSFLAVCRAHLDFIGSRAQERRQRKKFIHLPFASNLPGKGSILFRYYLAGKRTFRS